MISSVIERSMNRSPAIPSYREKSSGSPMRMWTWCGRHIREPIGLSSLGADHRDGDRPGPPASSAIRATPVLPL